MILKPSPVSTKSLDWDSEERNFFADISDLGKEFHFGRVYDDACDEGLTLVSEWTGREIVFVVYEEWKDEEGDILGWELKPVSNIVNCTITLFND